MRYLCEIFAEIQLRYGKYMRDLQGGELVTYIRYGMRSGTGGMLVGEAKAVEAMAFAARSTGVVMEATGAVVAVTES